MEYKMQSLNQSVETSQSKVKELEKTIHQMEQLTNSQNNKLMSHKLSKDDLIKKVTELELKNQRKQEENDELQRRFDEHMKSNQRTESSLYERINDMQAQIEML